jgi:hypothetical protein
MLTDNELLNNRLVFTGEIRLSDDYILQAWINGHGAGAVLELVVVDSAGVVVERWPEIPAKHLPLLKAIVGNTISLMRERDEQRKSRLEAIQQ